MQNLLTNTALTLIHSIQKNISFVLSLFVFSLFSCSLKATDSKSLTIPVVVISQIVQHISLDQEREGIIAALKEAGYVDNETIKIIYENAQGNMATANLIASNFASRKPTVAIAISTPSAQTLLKPMNDQQVPLVFTAVTDPLKSKLVTTLAQRPEAVTGVSDALMPGPQLDLMQKLMPSVKNIGIVYSAGETNSVKAVGQLQAEAASRGLTLVLATADKSSDVISATTKLIGDKVDAIYIPNDNTAVAAMESIVTLGKKYKIPIFAGDAGSVERGALAAQAYDRGILGRQAGALVVKLLKGEKAGDLAVEVNHPLVLMINLKSAQEMGVSVPDDIKGQAKIIGGNS